MSSSLLYTYLSGQLSSPEAHADGGVEAVQVVVALVALRHRDVDGDGEEDGDVHCNDRPGPTTTSAHTGIAIRHLNDSGRVENKNMCVSMSWIQSLTSAAPRYLP